MSVLTIQGSVKWIPDLRETLKFITPFHTGEYVSSFPAKYGKEQHMKKTNVLKGVLSGAPACGGGWVKVSQRWIWDLNTPPTGHITINAQVSFQKKSFYAR